MKKDARNTVIPDNILEIWQNVVNVISEILRVPSVMINRIEPPDLEIFRSNTSPDNPLPAGTRMKMAGVYCAKVASRHDRILVHDARKEPEWSDSPTAKAGIYAYLGFPICWPNGDVFGTLCAVDTKENKWGKRYEDLLMAFKSSIEMHLAVVDAKEQLDIKTRELEIALAEVKKLHGLLPICASCKKIRDDKGYWNQIETYISEHSDVLFTHSICPDCLRKLYPDLYKDIASD